MIFFIRKTVRRRPEPRPGHGARVVCERAVSGAKQADPAEIQREGRRGDGLQAGDGQRGAAADQDAGQQVQGRRHDEHRGHDRERRQGEAGLHCR